jgi:hypothetical protein
MNAYRTETVDTVAGEYVIELHYDEDASNPLTDWDHPGMAFWVNYDSSRLVETDTLDEPLDEAPARVMREFVRLDSDQDAVMNRFNKWRAITGSPWMLVAGEDLSSQSDYYRWFALVDTREDFGPDGHEAAVQLTMDVYRRWAAGEFCGHVVTGPDGHEVDSCWGIDDDDYALSEARATIEADVPERVAAANRVGSGFVGVL